MTDQPPKEGELILYRRVNDAMRIEVLYESETFWLDQGRMARLEKFRVRQDREFESDFEAEVKRVESKRRIAEMVPDRQKRLGAGIGASCI